MLHIQLLGAFNIRNPTQPIAALNTARLHSLLAYLLLQRGKPLARRQIAFTFWPESSDSQAQNNLRQHLPQPDAYLHADQHTLYWRLDSPHTLDLAAFEAALQRSRHSHNHDHGPAQIAALTEAAALYQGDLLPACYDGWLLPERQKYNHLAANALEELVTLHEERRNLIAARTLLNALTAQLA